MSIQDRRKSVLRSSISIDSIRKTTTNFSTGITKAQRTATEIAKQTGETNKFKSSLVRKDNEFFERRRENVRRKDREDELEASGTSGVAKRSGSIVGKSTRGFLGRIVDFFGIVLIGFFVTQLPIILKKFSILFKLIGALLNVLKFFTDGIANFLVDIEEGISGVISRIRGINLQEDENQLRDQIEDTESGLRLLDQDLTRSTNLFADPANVGLKSYDEVELIDAEDPEGKKAEEKRKKDQAEEAKRNEEARVEGKPQFDPEKFAVSENLSASEKQSEQAIESGDANKLLEGVKNQVDLQKNREKGKTQTSARDEEVSDEGENSEKVKNLGDRIKNLMKGLFGIDTETGIREDKTKSNVKEAVSKAEAEIKKLGLDDALANVTGKEGSNAFDLEPKEGFTNIEGMFDGFKSDNIDIEGLPEYNDFIEGMKKNQNVNVKRKRNKVLVINQKNNTPDNSGSAGGLNNSAGNSLPIKNDNDKNILKRMKSILLQ